MKRILLSLLTLITINVYAQQKGISYQALILNPKSLTVPGFDVANSPLASKKVCMLFEVVDGASQIEYQESVQTSTDQFGMVNLTIGNGTKTGGYAANFSRIGWVAGNKKLVVSINVTGTCANYTKISDQPITYTPYSLFAENANLSDGYITTPKLADGVITDAKVATGINKAKVGLGNADNTSDANKPLSTATQTALALKANLASPTFTGTPTLPTGTIAVTQTTGNNTAAIATTAFVTAAVAAQVGGFTHFLGEDFDGGIIYYLYKGSDGLEHGLIVSKTESTFLQWQSTNTLLRTNHTEDGAFNTNLMPNTGSPVKTYINGLGAGWYLPSIDELALLFYNRYSVQKALRAGDHQLLVNTNNGSGLWSSTEASISQAFAFIFHSNNPGIGSTRAKNESWMVRGIRAF